MVWFGIGLVCIALSLLCLLLVGAGAWGVYRYRQGPAATAARLGLTPIPGWTGWYGKDGERPVALGYGTAVSTEFYHRGRPTRERVLQAVAASRASPGPNACARSDVALQFRPIPPPASFAEGWPTLVWVDGSADAEDQAAALLEAARQKAEQLEHP